MAKITVLRVSEMGKLAAKTICLDTAGGVVKLNFDAGTWFHYSQKEVDGISTLSAVLLELAHDSQSLVIRGALAEGKDPTKTVRRWGVKVHGEEGYFQSVPQPWLLLDFDGIETPEEIDFIKQPKKGIQYLVSQLPEYFHDVSHHYHLSSGAGLDGGKTIRAHIWYWLDHPKSDDQLQMWAKSVNSAVKLIDESLFRTVQPHFTSDPVFKGVDDPFPMDRSGFIKGKADTVAFPPISIPDFKHNITASGISPTEAFSYYLSAVGDHEGGMGFHNPLMMAVWRYVLDHGAEGTDKVALKCTLKKVIAKADQSKHSPGEVAQKASDAHLDALIDGALIKIKAKGKTGKIEGLEPHYPMQGVLSAKAAQDELGKIVRSFFEMPRNIGIRAGAGLGKTTKVIAKVQKEVWIDKKIEIYVPTHVLAKEVSGALRVNPDPKAFKFPFQKYAVSGCVVQTIGGRDQITRGGDPYCLKNDVAKALVNLGLPVYPNLCRAGNISCEYYGECEYIRQFSDYYHVRVFPHAYLSLDRGFLDKDLPDYAVIDESYFQSMLAGMKQKEKPISLSEIKTAPCWPAELVKALVLAPLGKPLLSHLRHELGEDAAIDCIDSALAEITEPTNASIIGLSEHYQLEATLHLKPKSRLDLFLSVLKTELMTGRNDCHGIQFQVADQTLQQQEGFYLRYRRRITRFNGKKQGLPVKIPVLAIDADLTPVVHLEFFPDAEISEIKTERNCHVIQCYSTENTKTSLTIEGMAKERIKGIQSIVDRVPPDKSVLVLGPEVITGNDKQIPSKVTVPAGGALAHFNAIRGIDIYKKMDEIIVISRNQPPVNGAEAVARAVWFDSFEPLAFLGENLLPKVPRGYRTRTGYKVGVNVSAHPDQRVQTLIELMREAETLQGIDRLRLVHSNKNKRVTLLSNLVLDLTVDNLISWNEIVEGTTKLTEAWNKAEGVLPLSKNWLFNNFPELFANSDAAKEYLKKIGNQLGEISNSIIIRDSTLLSLYTYSLSGTTGPPAKCLSKFKIKETQQRLEELFAKAVTNIQQTQ